MLFEEIVYGQKEDGWTDAQRTKCDHKCTPCHYVTGELKRCTLKKSIQDIREGLVQIKYYQ